MKVVTLTLNPAFDLHCEADNFLPYSESIVKLTSREGGGKGINLSRALLSCGKNCDCLVVVGRENGEEFVKSLAGDGLKLKIIETEGRVRENITLHQKSKPETRISFEGFLGSDDILTEVQQEVDLLSPDYLTFTGSVPKGITKQKVLSFLKALKEKGVKLVLDSRSLTLEDIIEIKPWLIKPNKGEAEIYSKKNISSIGDAEEIAKKFCSLGIENVLISLGDLGAVLASKEKVESVCSPKINVVSTIGAGDSMIAGFISADIDGKSKRDCLRYAVACGSSACEKEGSNPPDEKRIEELFSLIK